ncbi:hypothetical protein EYF80_033381 [Liparis tanakae]|uniref:Uncharacterized protein n=1 Tax=Liparis tanakae TaxID=230148 RepID=A0A4Z2GT47_9TELE|nr:hypothetical protein EYF80_033381 [Liparis tanakae]
MTKYRAAAVAAAAAAAFGWPRANGAPLSLSLDCAELCLLEDLDARCYDCASRADSETPASRLKGSWRATKWDFLRCHCDGAGPSRLSGRDFLMHRQLGR